MGWGRNTDVPIAGRECHDDVGWTVYHPFPLRVPNCDLLPARFRAPPGAIVDQGLWSQMAEHIESPDLTSSWGGGGFRGSGTGTINVGKW